MLDLILELMKELVLEFILSPTKKMTFEKVNERINVLFNEIVKCQNQMCEYICNFNESHSMRKRLYWTNEIKKTRKLMKSLKTELSMYMF